MSKIKRIIRPMSRTAARNCIMSTCLSAVSSVVALFTSNAFAIALGLVFCVAAFIFKLQLKCPYCGLRGPKPQWSKSGTVKCARCKKLLEYDR